MNRAVIGLSGGINSSLACFLAAESLGPQHVTAVCMPYWSSSRDSLEDACLAIRKIGVKELEIDITPMVGPLFVLEPNGDSIRKGYVLAHGTGMIVLYDQIDALEVLVVGTSNKPKYCSATSRFMEIQPRW